MGKASISKMGSAPSPICTDLPSRRSTRPGRLGSSSPFNMLLTNNGNTSSASPLKTTSTKGNCRWISSPISPSQLAPPKTIVFFGQFCFTLLARASAATFCWNVELNPMIVYCSQGTACMQSSRYASTESRAFSKSSTLSIEKADPIEESRRSLKSSCALPVFSSNNAWANTRSPIM